MKRASKRETTCVWAARHPTWPHVLFRCLKALTEGPHTQLALWPHVIGEQLNCKALVELRTSLALTNQEVHSGDPDRALLVLRGEVWLSSPSFHKTSSVSSHPPDTRNWAVIQTDMRPCPPAHTHVRCILSFSVWPSQLNSVGQWH